MNGKIHPGTRLLGIDVGTTHCKAALFDTGGGLRRVSTLATPGYQSPAGDVYYRPEDLWQTIVQAVQQVIANTPPETIVGAGVASMAETGLLLDRSTGTPLTDMIPWFNTAAQAQAQRLQQSAGVEDGFLASGIRASFKCSLAKLLWLQENNPELLQNSIWLSAADYVVYRLTGQYITDYSLAGRTYAFRIDENVWNEHLLHDLGLDPDIFPQAQPAGSPLHAVNGVLTAGTPVCIAGHDHICAALAVGAFRPGVVLDSMGTAESLVGALPRHHLGEAEYASGLSFGCHVVPDQLYWLGGLSASGGSIEWIRSQLGEARLSYAEIAQLLVDVPEPTGILYFPYLSGSSILPSKPTARASFIGLKASHGRSHLVKAVLEGTAFEMERIRRKAEALLDDRIKRIVAVGGGTRNPHWLQIKADVSACEIEVAPIEEATLLGAAMIAGIGAGVYADVSTALAAVKQPAATVIQPDPRRHEIYRQIFETGYQELQQPLQDYFDLSSGD